MAMEIERKFLLKDESWRQAAHDSQRLRQGYLNREQRCSVRVRTSDSQAWLNIKSATLGAARQEFEYEIPLADAHELLDTLSLKPLIEKVRHWVKVGRHVWEIDEFEGDNAGLVVAEIELEHPGEDFDMPDWAGEEVTLDARYYNTCLCQHPFKDWR
ncbi:MAG: CYTH domain-containing protein [Candidatus Methylumidiphilus sp.]